VNGESVEAWLTPGWTWLVLLGGWLLLCALVWSLLRAAAWADRQAESWRFGRKAEDPTTVVGPDDDGQESGA
jgi:hypothetical protein